MAVPTELRVLELYSGIGGMNYSLKESGVKYEIIAAIDINTTANQIYQHNFPDHNLMAFGIEKISVNKTLLPFPTAASGRMLPCLASYVDRLERDFLALMCIRAKIYEDHQEWLHFELKHGIFIEFLWKVDKMR